MDDQEYGSVLLANAVRALCKLPGVGKRTAMRYALHLQMCSVAEQEEFIADLEAFTTHVSRCPICNNYSDDGAPCALCRDTRRDTGVLCIVPDVRDLLAILQAEVYTGSFFVLGRLINPLKGVSPADLPIQQLRDRIRLGVNEVILALPHHAEGEMTVLYLQRLLSEYPVQLSLLARGIPFGNTVDQTDETTMMLAFERRTILSLPQMHIEQTEAL